MRVLHINLARGWRGGERQTLLLMQGLRERGIESLLIARSGEPLAARAAADGFEVVASSGLAWLRTQAGLAHAHEARALQLGALWKAFHRRPLVATRRVIFRPGGGPITRLKYRAADRIAAISKDVARVMTEWGADPSRIRVVHSAVTTDDQSRPDRVAEIRARFAGKRIVGCIGALTPEKDHATLLRAAQRVQDVRDDVVFVLVGDGELRSDLEAQATASGLNNLVFEGYLDDPYSYFPLFDVFAMTSREEGLGTSILDAFVYGVPVVATDAGGIPELIIDGVSGALCPVGNDEAVAGAILELLADPALANRLREGARRHLLGEFTADKMAERYSAIYEELT